MSSLPLAGVLGWGRTGVDLGDQAGSCLLRGAGIYGLFDMLCSPGPCETLLQLHFTDMGTTRGHALSGRPSIRSWLCPLHWDAVPRQPPLERGGPRLEWGPSRGAVLWGKGFSSFSGGYAPVLYSLSPSVRPFTVKTPLGAWAWVHTAASRSCDVIVSLTGTVDLKTIEPFGLGFICNRSFKEFQGCLIHDVWYPSCFF